MSNLFLGYFSSISTLLSKAWKRPQLIPLVIGKLKQSILYIRVYIMLYIIYTRYVTAVSFSCRESTLL